MTLPSTTPTVPAPAAVLSVTSLLAAVWGSVPLPVLLEAANARILDADIDDADDWFMGSAFQRKDGPLVLVMPPARPEVERDTIARDLLARMLHVQLPGQTSTKHLAVA